MDGARLANALARTNVAPGAATWALGVDVLSFGATKNGALAAEAVLFFDPARAEGMAERRKRAGHLVSKHRFLAAQFEAYLTDHLWLDLARRSNAMADLVAHRLANAGLPPVWPVQSNAVFVKLPRKLDERLRREGATYHAWPTKSVAGGIAPDEVLVRLVASFATTEADVERFAHALERAQAALGHGSP
jgi:threonine aldolase